jgi:hypothetical protein
MLEKWTIINQMQLLLSQLNHFRMRIRIHMQYIFRKGRKYVLHLEMFPSIKHMKVYDKIVNMNNHQKKTTMNIISLQSVWPL